jgi:hypothetical protein
MDRWWLTTWISATVIILLYSWFCLVCRVLREVYKGFDQLPPFLQFCTAHGSVAFSLLGIGGAAGLLLARRTGRRRLQSVLFLVLVLLLLWCVRLLFRPAFLSHLSALNH